MARFASILLLCIVLCIVGARNLEAGCCFLWTEYGWSACHKGIDADSCAKIQSNQGWYRSQYITRSDCKCYDHLPYYLEDVTITIEGEEVVIPAIHRWVILASCYPELDGTWRASWDFDEAWSNLDYDTV